MQQYSEPLSADLLTNSWESNAQQGYHPGRFLLRCSILIVSLMLSRALLWRFGIPVNQRVLSGVGSLLAIALLWQGLLVFMSRRPRLESMNGFIPAIQWMGFLVFVMTAWGFARGNMSNEIVKDAIAMLIFIAFLLLGRYDEVWRYLRGLLLMIFYAAFVGILLTFQMPGVVTSYEGSQEAITTGLPRHLQTIGYSLRPFMTLGLLLGSLGLVQRGASIRRFFEINCITVYAIVNVLIFGFRTSIIYIGLVLLMFLFIKPVLQRRLQVGTILILLVIGAGVAAWAISTTMYERFAARLMQGELFTSRIEEAKVFFGDMGAEVLIGRGMGGYYQPPHWANAVFVYGRLEWHSNHFGFLAFVLRGGIAMLALVIVTMLPIFYYKSREWLSNDYNLCALLMAPVILAGFLFNPISMGPDGFFAFLVWGFCLARFSTPVQETHQ